MALTQLITTIETTTGGVGVNNITGTTSGIALGTAQNVGIGIADAVTGLHLGGLVTPAVYLADATATPLPAIAANDGVFSVLAGVPTFTNSIGANTLLTVLNAGIGSDVLAAGTVVVTNTIVTTGSRIFLTRTSTTGDVTTMGTLSVIADNGFFTVNSTVATDISNFNWLIIN